MNKAKNEEQTFGAAMTQLQPMTPPPGSPEATKQGCTCPIFDNCKGRGCGLTDKDGEPLYYIHKRCPLHGAVLNSQSTLQEPEL